MEKILNKNSLKTWLQKIKDSYSLYSIINDEYKEIENLEKIEDNIFKFSTISPKKFVFPQREKFIKIKRQGKDAYELKEETPSDKKSVVIGIKPCEGKGLLHLDKVFTTTYKDPYYIKRRENTIFIGTACNVPPHQNCFCIYLNGSPHNTEGLDILITDLEDGNLYINFITDRAKELFNLTNNSLFQEITEEYKQKFNNIKEQAIKNFKREVKDIKKVTQNLENMFDNPIWEKQAQSCIQCGICTYLCPTCHCFDINDEVINTSPLIVERVRTWDNCQFPDFTMHSSGHNPRATKGSRLRQRIYHKFLYFVQVFNTVKCVGCGRCITYCPMSIDLIEILNEVVDHG